MKERFTVLIDSRFSREIRAFQIYAENRAHALQLMDAIEMNTYAVLNNRDVELITHLYYRVTHPHVCDWMRGIIEHASTDKESYWVLVDDTSELEDDNLLTNVQKIVVCDQRRRYANCYEVYEEFLNEIGQHPEHDDILVNPDFKIEDVDCADDDVVDEDGYMTLHMMDNNGCYGGCKTYRVKVSDDTERTVEVTIE